MNKYKILLGSVFLLVLSFITYTGLASAHSFKTGKSVVVDKGQIIQHSLFAAGNSVDIGSEVYGDIFCAGQTVNVTGTVHGDVICAGQTVNITGKVDGDVRLAGQNVTVSGAVAGNATIGAQTFTVSTSGSIGKDVTLGSSDGSFNGVVGRDIAAGGGTITISNVVGRDIKGSIENLKLSNTANIKGSIDFTSNNDIQRDGGAVVGGKVTRSDVAKKGEPKHGAVFGFGIGWFIYWFLAMLLTAMVLALLFPRLFQNITNRATPRPWKALLTGLLANIAAPIVFVVLAITIIGIPLALIAGMLWVVVLILSGPVAGYFLGRQILRSSKQPLLIMLSGASLLLVLYFIPILGLLALILATWGGTGMILLELFRRTPKPNYDLASGSTEKSRK